jgi:DNA polymerase III sliding clamp (beta) subunit (PCNA family)
LVSADGFRLAVLSLDYDGEGQALINRDDLKGVVSALRRAKRARVSFEPSGDSLDGMSLVIDTEQVRYRWTSVNGNYPDWQKLIPSEFKCFAHFDTVEAVKAVNSLKVLSDSKSYPIDLAIGDGKMVMANPDDKGQAELSADTDGQGFVRLDGQYLADVLKACGGMVDFSINNASSPMLFSQDGYRVVVMPMITEKAQAEAKEAKAEAATAEQAEAKAEAEPEETETEPQPEPAGAGGKRSRKKS